MDVKLFNELDGIDPLLVKLLNERIALAKEQSEDIIAEKNK